MARIIGAALVSVALLGACSALKLGYGQLPTLAYWWLDGYVGFDRVQERRVRDELQRWVDWHRRTQLGAYAAHLARVRDEASRPVTGAQVCRASEATRALLEVAVERVLPAAAEIVPTLTPAQLEQIDARYRERTRELREEMLPPDPQERQRASLRRAVKRFESFYGDLGAEQRQMLEEALRESPFDAREWLAQRDRRHQQLLEMLRAVSREALPGAQAQERLRVLVRAYDGRAPLGSAARSDALTRFNCELAARVHNSASPAQRRHLAEKLAGWEADLLSLAGAATARAVVAPIGP